MSRGTWGVYISTRFWGGGSAEDRCRSLKVWGSTNSHHFQESDNEVGSVDSLKNPLEIKGLLSSWYELEVSRAQGIP